MNKSLEVSLILVCFLIGSSPLAVSAAGPADSILQQAGVRGGVIVHVGCGDGTVTTALRAGDSFLVHGLDTNAANVDAARAHIQKHGLYGPVSVDTFDGRTLPYVGNFVNLLVADDLGQVSMNEVMRVLVPNGVALIAGAEFVKPCPQEIDD